MTTKEILLSWWEIEPSVGIGCAVILLLYFYSVKWKFDGKGAKFLTGVALIFFALCSPIDALGDDYLFSAHMVQHMMLGLLAPVFFVSGLTTSQVETILKLPFARRLEKILGYPPLALIVANAVFWVWHLPSLYNLTLENDHVHILEHEMLIVTGTMLWWPVFKPIAEGRLKPIPAVIYMFISAFLGTILGSIFTLSDTPFYTGYMGTDDDTGALKLIREGWGLSLIGDQKLGGAIMWEPGGVVFLWAIMRVMIGWYRGDGESEPAPVEKTEIEYVGTH